MLFDEEPVKPFARHLIGQDISLLSIGELEERIDQLKAEIARLEEARAAKGSHRSAADALFRSAAGR
jgi:uncharacterized small protein (DUF1192 family)